jgi:hypothetical protein
MIAPATEWPRAIPHRPSYGGDIMWRPSTTQVLCRLVLCAGLASGLTAARTLEAPSFTFTYDNMTDAEAENVFARARDAYPAIISYLGLTNAPKVVINDFDGGDNAKGQTRIEAPAGSAGLAIAAPRPEPVRISIPVRYMRQQRFNTAVVHEMTHALAGVPAEKNLFLAEGLAVHVHGVLSRTDEAESFANFPIHQIANRILQRFERTDLVRKIYTSPDVFSTANDKQGDGINAAVGYAVAGSFVTFLIQRNGSANERRSVADFMRIYRGASFRDVYGASLSQLEQEWVRFIASEPQPDYYMRPSAKPTVDKAVLKKLKPRSS